MQSRKLFFSLFFLLLSLFAQAQEAWTLQQCINYALSHNLQIKQSELSAELASDQRRQSRGNMMPTLNGNATNNYFFGKSIDPNTNLFTNQEVRSNAFGIGTNAVLFEGFSLQNTLKQSNLNYMSGQYDLKKIQNDISLNVVTYYLQVLYNQEQLRNTSDQLEATKLQYERTKRMYEVGALAKGSFLDIEAQLATDESRLVAAQSQLDQSLLLLTQLLELESTKNFSIQTPLIELPSEDIMKTNVDSVYAIALKTQPDIISYEYRLQSAEKGLSIAKGGYYPRLSFSAAINSVYTTSNKTISGFSLGNPTAEPTGYTSGGDTVYTVNQSITPIFQKTPFSKQMDDNLNKSIGFNLTVPLFNGWTVRNNVNRARINVQQSQLTLQSIKNAMYKSVQQASLDAKSSYKKFVANKKSAEALKEAMDYSEQKYTVGMISTFDYLTAKNNLANANALMTQSKYDYIFKVKVLDFYQGKPLTF